MISLLIVDDEELTREGIANIIDLKYLQIDQVFLAKDGEEALQICKNVSPTIVLTDVRMPIMDGIKLGEHIRKKFPECKIVFMSGYMDKEYLLSAIEIGALKYIEKPIDKNKLIILLKEIVANCIEERATKNESNNILTTDFCGFLTNSSQNIEKYKNLNMFSDFLNKDLFLTVIIKFYEEEEGRLLKELKNINVISFYKEKDTLVIYFCKNNLSESISEYAENYIINALKKINIVKYKIAVSLPVNSVYEISKSYSECVYLVQKLFYHDYKKIIFQSIKADNNVYELDNELIDNIAYNLINGQKDEIIMALNDLTHYLSINDDTLVSVTKKIYFDIINLLAKHIDNSGLSKAYGIKNNYIEFNEIYNIDSLAELLKYTINIYEDYFTYLRKSNDENYVSKRVMEYVENNYKNTSLSIKDISDYIHISLSYMCTVYKKETGNTVNASITQCRINKAKEYLEDFDKKVLEIAKLVGYEDQNYFARLFKKTVGLTPTEYRERIFVDKN